MLGQKCWLLAMGVLVTCVLWHPCESKGLPPRYSMARVSDIKLEVLGLRDSKGFRLSSIRLKLGAENGQDAIKWTEDFSSIGLNCRGETLTEINIDTSAQPNADYEHLPGIGYYKFHGGTVSWYKAKEVCEQEGAHLAVINSLAESNAIAAFFSRQPPIVDSPETDVASIGFHDMYVEGDYRTIFGEPLASTGFLSWYPGYRSPDNYEGSDTHPGEDCGSIQKGGLLNDINCDYKHAFICEQELERPKKTATSCLLD